MTIDILCRVVDNYGDIGFVYRLVRALSELPDQPKLRLIVDDLSSFSQLCPQINAGLALQTVDGLTVARWTDPGEAALRLFDLERPRYVLECYACGRPEWFESILFDFRDSEPRHIVNLEYLTAEPWARDFHRLPSLTRSPLVKKTVFMPGFEPGTGGLLQDSAFCSLLDACSDPGTRLSIRQSCVSALPASALRPGSRTGPGFDSPEMLASAFWFTVFSYEHDFTTMMDDLAVFNEALSVRSAGATMRGPSLVALVAAGRSSAPFLDAWNRAGQPFPVLELPFLPQQLWDRFLVSSDFAVIRGEESFSRVALTGRPFLWQCYPFGDIAPCNGGQLPKVHAFLDLVRPLVNPDDFAAYEKLTRSFNRAGSAESGSGELALLEPSPGELLAVLRLSHPTGSGNGAADSLPAGFADWSRKVRNLGNLASNLVTFMRDLG